MLLQKENTRNYMFGTLLVPMLHLVQEVRVINVVHQVDPRGTRIMSLAYISYGVH